MNILQKTIPCLLQRRCELSPGSTAFYELNPKENWRPISWLNFQANVDRVSIALLDAGVGKGDLVGIMAPTSLNWEYAQIGTLSIAAIVVGIDQNYQQDQLEYIFRYLNLSVLCVQDHLTLSKIPAKLLEQIKLIILFEGDPQAECEQNMKNILTINRKSGFQKSHITPDPMDIAIIVFSSGTTGMPKAVHYSHFQLVIAIEAIRNAFGDIKEGAIFLCWLPLASLFQRVVNFWGISVGATSYVLNNPRDLMHHIRVVNPYLLIGVPRLFIRIHSDIENLIQKSIWPVSHLMSFSLRIGRKYTLAQLTSNRTSILSRVLWHIVNKLFLARIRAMFGTEIRYFISGSAAMPLWLLEWFEGVGLPVLEAYGVSEDVVPIAINRPGIRRLGTVGKPLSSNEVRLSEDGEILVRGLGVFLGYWKNSESTDRFTAAGYLCTNDLGYFDEDGFLSLVGRKSDIFKTPEGKWVSPVRIEGQLQRISYIEQCIVFQLRSGKIAAILCVDKDSYMKGIKLDQKSISVSKNDMELRDQSLCINIGEELQHLPKYLLPIGIIITYKRFTIEMGELTTNMKLRRSAIINHYAPVIEQLEQECMKTFNNKVSLSCIPGYKPILVFA